MIWRHLRRENNEAKVDPSSLIQCPPSYRGGFLGFALWAWYCRHFNRERIVDKAYEYASMCRQRELREAITAFQAWLSKEFKNAPKAGGAR